MKATNITREAHGFVDVRRNGEGGVTYKCLKCGLVQEANAYYEADHKTMMAHAAQCSGEARQQPRAVQVHIGTDIEALNEQVKLFAGHIKACIPNGKDLTNDEAIALARISMATDLSPFIGEVWYIHGLGPHIGIRGLRRKAKEQGLYSKSFRAMRNEEIEEHDVRPCDVGYICELFRHDLTKEAAEINRLAGQPIIPIKPVVGIGIWRKRYEEIAQYKDDRVPHGKSPAWVAKKRAEADALSQAYDIGINLPYSDVGNHNLEVADTEDAGWSVIPEDPRDTALPVEYSRGRAKLFKAEEAAQVVQREVAHNAERHAQADASAAPNLDDTVAKYKDVELELPPWVEEIRAAVEAHPQASDPLTVSNGSFVKQLELSAGRKVPVEQFRAFVQVVLTHPLDEVTFGEAAVLMDVINADDFEAKVVGLLS